jgi:hypothetical protein
MHVNGTVKLVEIILNMAGCEGECWKEESDESTWQTYLQM